MMKTTSIFGLFFVCVLVATCAATSPTDVFSAHDAAVTGRLALASQAKDGTFADVESAHWTLSALHLLKMKTELEQHKAAVCSFVKQNLDRAADVPTVYHSVSVRELLDCKDKVGTAVVDLLEQGAESDSLEEIYQSVVALATLKRTGAIEFVEDLSGVAKAVHDLMEVDGTFRSGSKSEEGSALSTGHAYHTLALLKKHFSLSPEGQEHVATVVQTVDDFLNTAREEEGMLEFTDLNPLANLKATSLVWTGANALAAVADGAVAVTQDQVTGLAEYFVRNKYVTNAEDAHYLLMALKTVAHNNFKLSPLVVTLSKSSILTSSKGDEGLVKVLVTDVFGQFAERVAVYISKVFPVDQEKQILLRNQQAQPLSDSPQNVAYSFNFLATKPDQGFYSLEISVSPLEKNSPYLPVEETTRIVKVVAVVDLTEATLQISDSKEHDDDSFASNPLSLQFPNKLADTLRANSLQTIVLSFRAQASGRPVSVNQAFLRFTNLETKHEAVFVAEQHGKKYKFSVNVKDQVDAFQGRSGKYALTLVVGDALIQNPTAWEVATIHIQFGKLQRESVPEATSGPLPEIVHQFRAPDKRPPPVVSFVFTALVLAPFAAFLIGLLYVGANFRNFPFSNPKSLFFAAGFQACIGCLFGLFVVYWLRLTMVQTLCYLLVLGLVTIFFGQQALRYVAAVREHKKVD